MFLSLGIPLLRAVMSGEVAPPRGLRAPIWAWSSIFIMQLGYWLRYHKKAPVPKFVNIPLSHLVLFLGRMGFVIPGTVFSIVFIVPITGLVMPPWRYLVTLAGLFSLFCYTLEIERLGNALSGPENLH